MSGERELIAKAMERMPSTLSYQLALGLEAALAREARLREALEVIGYHSYACDCAELSTGPCDTCRARKALSAEDRG